MADEVYYERHSRTWRRESLSPWSGGLLRRSAGVFDTPLAVVPLQNEAADKKPIPSDAFFG